MGDCSKHSGQKNESARAPLEEIMKSLPYNQGGEGRHKCP